MGLFRKTPVYENPVSYGWLMSYLFLTFSHIYLTYYQFGEFLIPEITRSVEGQNSNLFLYETTLQVLYLIVGVVAGNIGWEFAGQIKQNKEGAVVRLFDAAAGFVFFSTILSLTASILPWILGGSLAGINDLSILIQVYSSKLGMVVGAASMWLFMRRVGLKTGKETSNNPYS